jgi:hypothetical protein
VIVSFGQFYENYRNRPHFWDTVCHGKGYALIFDKTILGYILGDFFTHSSGHPEFAVLQNKESIVSIVIFQFILKRIGRRGQDPSPSTLEQLEEPRHDPGRYIHRTRIQEPILRS